MGDAGRTGAVRQADSPRRHGPPSGLQQSLMTGAETLIGTTELDEPQVLQFERGATIERYTVLDRIGAGAMGVVYTAYDPRLDRRVALKVMHARPGPRGAEIVARLLREAQALAKLQHPNVVAIYDANAIGDLVYLTMELVDGSNLARWLKGKHSAAEILETFVDAGRGLSAAHRAGIVHRDFKPDNVLVGRDGRVRVVDFGIARGSDGPEFSAVAPNLSQGAAGTTGDPTGPLAPFESTGEGEIETPPNRGPLADTDPAAAKQQAAAGMASQGLESAMAGLSSLRLTQTGALVGTPAYMAPEQHLAVRVDARADQFSFCVALFEALFGAHPFPAKSYMQLTTSVLGGKIDASPVRTSVPLHVRRAILRGLSVDPCQRFETMDDLLAALAPAERRRRTLGGALAMAGVAAALTGLIAWTQIGAPVCEGADRRLAGVWDERVKEEARQAFLATGQPYAARAAETAAAALDEYAEAWVVMRREVCEASLVHHEQSALLLDRRMTCLDRHLDQLQATTTLFREADTEVVMRAVVAVDGLPELNECSDAERLMHGDDGARAGREELARLEGMLAHAAAQRNAAKVGPAQALAEQALQEAKALGAASSEAQALLTLGYVANDQGRFEQAAELLGRAIAVAESAAADTIRAQAMTQLGVVLGVQQSKPVEGERVLRMAAAIDARIGAGPVEHARRDTFMAMVLSERGELEVAREMLLTAVAALRAGPASARLSMLMAFNALGLLEERSGRGDEARAYYGDALVLAEDRLGPDHPDVAALLNNIGVLEEQYGRYEASIAAHERALDIRVRTLGPDQPEIAASRMNLGNALVGIGEYGRAISYFEAAVAVLRRSPEAHHTLASALYNLANCHHLRQDFERAVPIYEEALARSQTIYAADDPDLAYPLHGLGVALVELGRLAEARPLLERALAIRTREGVEPIDLGELRFALARSVVGDDRARALKLAAAARADYAELRASEQVTQIDGWLLAEVGR